MSTCPAGHIMSGDDGRVHIFIWEGRYYLAPEDLGTLFFTGAPVLLLKKGSAQQVFKICGNVYLSPSGQAVLIATDQQRYMVPRARFLAVAFGDESKYDFYEVPEEETDIEIISPHKESAIS